MLYLSLRQRGVQKISEGHMFINQDAIFLDGHALFQEPLFNYLLFLGPLALSTPIRQGYLCRPKAGRIFKVY